MDGQKRELVLAAVALVVVLAFGFLGYGVMSRGAEPSSTTVQTEDTKAQDAGAAAGASSAKESGSDGLPLLADHDATVYTESGDAMRLSAIANGKPLVINFWATWCPYCIQEMPDFQEIYRDYGDRVSFAFVDQADGNRETVEAAKDWLVQNGYEDLPAYYDTDLEASYMFSANALPTTIVVAANGEVQTVIPGMIAPESIRSMLDALV